MSSYFFLGLLGACVKAEPATDFCAGVLFGLANCFAAVLATLGEVVSLAGLLVDAMDAPYVDFWTPIVPCAVAAHKQPEAAST